MHERFDVVVIGAGPAGSATAYRLAAAGGSVLLADRALFPRDKPCGGGLTRRALRELPVPIEPVVEDRVSRLELRLAYRDRTRFERASTEPLIAMTRRSRLDAFLAAHAAEAGADFRDGVRVSVLKVGERCVWLEVGGRRVEAAAFVAADGANGTARRALGLGEPRDHAVALEGTLPYGLVPRERYAGRAIVELGTVPGGYGWVVPKEDHINVGIGGWEREGPRLRERLARLCAAHGFPAELRDVRGHRLPMRMPGAPLARGRVLLVGDAAGLVDPLTGDGMYGAFLSARLAAEATLDLLAGRTRDLEPYGAALSRELDPLHATALRARLAFDGFPRIAFTIARTRISWRVAEAFLTGDLRQASGARGLARVPLALLAAAARVPGRREHQRPGRRAWASATQRVRS